MNKSFLLTVTIAVFLCASACSKDGNGNPDKPSGERSMHQSSKNETAGSGIADAIKMKTLAGYESTTIGNAFDSYKYFAKKEWKETTAQNGKIYIDFIGWLDDAGGKTDGVSARALDVKFVINPDGSFIVAMLSKIEAKTDGKLYVYPLEDIGGMLAKIYANKEITF